MLINNNAYAFFSSTRVNYILVNFVHKDVPINILVIQYALSATHYEAIVHKETFSLKQDMKLQFFKCYVVFTFSSKCKMTENGNKTRF